MPDTAELQHLEVRPCGECPMCCKLLSIVKKEGAGKADFPFDKPTNKWCPHCAPGRGGCTIWNTNLPNLCRTYQCRWKVDPHMPEEWRPDKVRAIFDANHTVIERFPEEMFFYITFADDEIRPALEHFIQRPDASFVICHGDEGMGSGRTAEISKAIEEQFRLGRKL